jgi:hypothetical protein
MPFNLLGSNDGFGLIYVAKESDKAPGICNNICMSKTKSESGKRISRTKLQAKRTTPRPVAESDSQFLHETISLNVK